MSNRQLIRSKSNRVIAGVAGGIADYLGADLTIVRLITAAIVVFLPGPGAVGYILAWIILPEEGNSTTGLDKIMGAIKTDRPNPNPDDLR
ncbi:MAG: PspC domain-containing protein [Propionibacteriaceae bacterium]|nr:PspC domain-containing protein [Propionibacteriaceae bacterium]